MKKSEMVEIIANRLSELALFGNSIERQAELLLETIQEAGMAPPSIPTGANGWEVGKGSPSYINEWESATEDHK